MIAQRRTARANGLREDVTDRRYQRFRAFADDRRRGSSGRNAGAKQALASINVTHARDHALIEYRRFHRRGASAELRRQITPREVRLQRFGSQFGQHWMDGSVLGRRQVDEAEAAGVMITHRNPGPGLKLDVIVGLQRRRFAGKNAKTTRHTQVAEQDQVPVQTDQQELGPAADRSHATAGYPGLKVRRDRESEVWSARRYGNQPLTLQDIGQTLANGFNFGKFGHGPKVARTFRFGYGSVP